MFIYVYRCACINAKFWTRNSVEKLPMYDIASQKPYLDRESLFFCISGVPDRAARRFFTVAVLRPAGGNAYVAVSQKILSATACRYMILWCSSLLMQIQCDDEPFLCLAGDYCREHPII